ncbi:hypothetical protein [Deinococcus hohokamensis]|uniref:DUF2339 domain-containing protein n=1 Tax=Deinococcus hohokamensis TaxID=309883 RepID=A0ABV9IEC4_9DEIO
MPFLFDLFVAVVLVTLLLRSARLERKLDEALRRLTALQQDTVAPVSPPAHPEQAPPPAAVPPFAGGTALTFPQKSSWPAPQPLARPVPERDAASPATARHLPPMPLPAAPEAAPQRPAQPRRRSWWPEIDLGAPEYSRARMSVIGGGLVIAGLAWTLRSLGLPGWTTLASVYGFAALLWLTARGIPQPVAGALRGLAYAAAALGLGGLAQQLGPGGPAVVLGGLLVLSGAMARRSIQAGEPLLAALATTGAAVSTWMLTDDLGPWSPLAMGLAGLIPALAAPRLIALLPAGPSGRPGEGAGGSPADPAASREGEHLTREASLVLTVLAAAALPAGHLVAALSHAAGLTTLAGALHLDGWGPWAWVGGSLLALATAVSLLRGAPGLPARPANVPRPEYQELGTVGAFSAAAPLVCAAGALGAGVHFKLGGALFAVLILGVAGGMLAAWAWRTQRREALAGRAAGAALAGALAGGATAGTTSLAGTAIVGLLGATSRPLAFTGLGAALAGVGLAAHSRTWARAGGALSGLSLLVAAGVMADGLASSPGLAWATAAALGGSWWLALRLSLRGWRPEAAALSLGTGLAASTLALAGPLEGAFITLLLGILLWSQPRFFGRPRQGDLGGSGPLVAGALFGLRPGWQVGTTVGGLTTASAALTGGLPSGSSGWALLLLALAGSALALIASRADPAPLPRQVADPVMETSAPGADPAAPPRSRPASPPAPLPQHAAWAATALLMVGVGSLGGAGPTAAVALALAIMAADSHLAGLRRGAWLSALALGSGAVLVGLEMIGVIIGQLWAAHEGTRSARLVEAPSPSWLPVAAWSVLGVWALLHTPTGRAGWVRWVRAQATLPPMPARVLRAPLIAAGLALAVSSLWLWVPPALADVLDGPLASLGSLGALVTGMLVALGAWRWGGVGRGGARSLWDMGVGIGAAAGLKGAALDARLYDIPRAASGLAVLVTGLALLLLAVRAPRPGKSEGSEGSEEDIGAALVTRSES